MSTKLLNEREMENNMTNLRMNMASFESFRRVDVYGFAMVMWETVRRCMTHDGVEVSCLDDEDNGVDCSGDYDDDDNENDDKGSFSGFCVAIPRHGPPRSRLRGHAQGTRMTKYYGKTVLL